MNERFKSLYMDIAFRTAKMSRAVRLNVGSIIVKDDRIISYSWNGTPAGWDNNCENKEELADGSIKLVTKPEVLHAESNALMKLAKNGGGANGASIFITHAPCIECAKMIYQAGITEVYYSIDYRSRDGIEFLQKCNVPVEQVLQEL